MHAEDLQTNYVNIGPVSKAMHLIVTWQEGGKTHVNNANFQKHVLRVPDYLWVAEDGMKMAGYNGSQCWDTSFAAQACVEAGLGNEFPLTLRRTFQYFEKTQILSTNASQATDAFVYESEDMRQQFYRHVSLGGWPFSTSAHGENAQRKKKEHESHNACEGMHILRLATLTCFQCWFSPSISLPRLVYFPSDLVRMRCCLPLSCFFLFCFSNHRLAHFRLHG
jgi:hypothetical protein